MGDASRSGAGSEQHHQIACARQTQQAKNTGGRRIGNREEGKFTQKGTTATQAHPRKAPSLGKLVTKRPPALSKVQLMALKRKRVVFKRKFSFSNETRSFSNESFSFSSETRSFSSENFSFSNEPPSFSNENFSFSSENWSFSNENWSFEDHRG